MDISEREHYRAAIQGDRDAFEMIIRTHSRTLFAIAYGILQSPEEAGDVVQDSLSRAWKMRWRVRDPEKLPVWLSMIARHRAHDAFRKRRHDFTYETQLLWTAATVTRGKSLSTSRPRLLER